MKSYAAFVMTLYDGVFFDAAIRWPDIRSTMEVDMSYLRRAFEQRGLAFFTLTLGDYGHWIDRSLDHGSFIDSRDIPRGIPKNRRRPGLFQGVLSKVFDDDGVLRSDADHEAVLFLRTLTQSLKKLEVPVKTTTLRKTVKEFFDVEAHLPKSYPGTWDCEVPTWIARAGHPLWGGSPSASDQPDLFGCTSRSDPHPPWDTLRELSRRVLSDFGVPERDALRPKHGPGVVSESGWISKYEFPTWPRKLEAYFPFDWFGSGDLSAGYIPEEREVPSRLTAVPKSQKGPRLICSEPLSNQWMQQSIWGWIKGRIRKTVLGRSISFDDQGVSKLWALQASHDRSLATLDLSSASDRLSTRLVEYIFQGQTDFLDMMHACRTRAMEQVLDTRLPKLSILRKFSTMGSALTFPIQSICFTILCVWALRLYEGRENDWKAWKADFDRVRVFGDDLIVPIEAYGLTKFVLHECGLSVNTRKSFGGVSFRESCGMDAFRGVDVTPARHRTPYSGTAKSTAALVAYANNLFKTGLWYTSDAVLGFLPPQVRKLLVVSGPNEGSLGLFSFVGNDFHQHKLRWDSDLQRSYIRRLAFSGKVRRVKGRGNSSLIQFFAEDPVSRHDRLIDDTVWESGRAVVGNLTMRRSRVYL